MAKIIKAQKQSVPSLTGTVVGKRFTAKLEEIKVGDKWENSVLPAFQNDGLGTAFLDEGEARFQFKGSTEPTVVFKATDTALEVTDLQEIVDSQSQSTASETEVA